MAKASNGACLGVYCDGSLCSSKSKPVPITGVSYKCSMCEDVDFCASCQAQHDRTHPLLRLEPPVLGASLGSEDEKSYKDVHGGFADIPDQAASTSGVRLGAHPSEHDSTEPRLVLFNLC